MEELVRLVKLQNMWSTSSYDELIKSKIMSCIQDLQCVGILCANIDCIDPLIREAILTYCAMNMGKPSKDEYDRLKKAYDEMKGQMQLSRDYGLRYADGEN